MTLHRFAHLGDLHLGPNSRNTDRRRALDQAIAEQDTPGLSAWLWPGDLNHSRMTIEDRNWLVPRVQRMANRAPVVICYGNHDLPGDLHFLSELHAIWPIYVIDRPQVVRVRLVQSDVDYASIFVLPYPSKAGLVAAGTPHDQIVEQARLALDAIFMDAAAKLEAARAQGEITLMIGHVNVAGSIMSAGQPNIGKEIEIDRAILLRLGPIYKGLNHIHRRQHIGGAFYAGSMCRLDWAEVDPKAYSVIEIEAGVHDVFIVRQQPIDVAPLYHVDGELTTSGFQWWITRSEDGAEGQPPVRECGLCFGTGDGLRHPQEGTLACEACKGSGSVVSWDGCEVRVRYRYNADERAALDFSLVNAPFVGAKRFDPEPIAVHNRAVRAPEVAAAKTLAEKVEMFVRVSGLSWSPGLEAKLAALQTADGAAFLTHVQQELAGKPEAEVVHAAV